MSEKTNKLDSTNPGEYISLYRFIYRDLGLRNAAAIVYARIYGFNENGREYFESVKSLASFLNLDEKSIRRSLSELIEKGLIEECGKHVPSRGRATKTYRVTVFGLMKLEGVDLGKMMDKMSTVYEDFSDKLSSKSNEDADKSSAKSGSTIDISPELERSYCPPISKKNNKDFR